MGTFGSFTHPQPEKKPGMGSGRGESRFKGLMGKGSLEDLDKGSKEKSSLASLGSVSEAEPSHSQTWAETRFSRPTSNDTDPYPDDDRTAGSAALRGAMDVSPQRQQGLASYGTPQRLGTRDDTGISAFGMTSDPGLFHNAHQTPQHRNGLHEPMSPTNTNPYQSPNHGAPHHNGGDNVAPDYQNSQFSGMGSFHADHSAGTGLPSHPFGGLGSLGRASGAFVEHAASDRSQTSSVGPARGFPTIPGLGGGIPGLGGSNAWPTGSQPLGTPVRERGFGGGLESMFGAFGESQSPSLSGLGSSSLFGAGHGGTLGRTSRLGSLFPTAMQEQMRSEQHRPPGDEASQGDRLQSMTGRAAFGSQVPSHGVPVRDSDSPFRNTRNLFEDFTGGHMDDAAGQPANLTTSLSMAALNQTRTAQPSAQTPVSNNTASNQPPQPQQRRMVMPDRMRWIYRDPTGNVQGPFSGLEMHDWYKGGFFSPELQVKKQEDGDYEPLLQLIRRIGNSREPFLVPQIGISYGEDSPVAGNAWPGAATAGPASGAQPPFANAFPSFGTTLTAEQQNALERRKQEEQYLMARQKEHLNQQQQIAKQTQMGHSMLSHPLQHHSSAHSLHSQPSYGSITSPGGYQPSPTQGPLPGGPAVPGLLDNAFRATHVPGLGPVGPGMDMLGNIREEDVPAMMDHLNLGRPGQQTFGTAPPNFGQQQPDSNIQSHQVVTMLNDRARLQREQAEHDARQHLGQSDHLAQASNERLQQFRELRLQTDLHQVNANTSPPEGVIGKPTASAAEVMKQEPESRSPVGHEPATYAEPMSLTEQVQKASAKQAPPAQSAWNKVETAIHPFPPPLSQSPLPAPAAQRKPIAADSLAAEVQSRSQTPSADTPSASIAPWAKEPAEALRGPSLREIQEAEAKKAAEREALAAAARREAFEQELLAQSQAPAAQPGLPSSSTWASGASPITPVAANASVWGAKPLAGKAQGQSTANAKKTLQQIQKEEEARKLRAASQAAATANAFPATPQPLVSGKRYADLASKNAAAQPIGGGAWTTVGSSGKSKIPGAIPAPPTPVRSTSSTVIPAAIKKPVVTRSTTLGGQGATQVNAQEEFKKWVLGELRGDLQKKGINRK
jgi:PERQ amino acid-rich with GYF domain-containing protein